MSFLQLFDKIYVDEIVQYFNLHSEERGNITGGIGNGQITVLTASSELTKLVLHDGLYNQKLAVIF